MNSEQHDCDGCFALKRLEFAFPKRRQPVTRFGKPSPVDGCLFRRVETAPERIDHMRFFLGRKLQGFFFQGDATHVANLLRKPVSGKHPALDFGLGTLALEL